MLAPDLPSVRVLLSSSCKRTICQLFVRVQNNNADEFIKMPYINLSSSDSHVFAVDIKAAQQSLYVKKWLDSWVYAGADEELLLDPSIAMPDIKSSILEKLFEWCTYHKDDPPYDENKIKDDICEWDREFFNLKDRYRLFEIIMAANKLEIKGLVHASKVIVKMPVVKLKSSDDKVFSVDFKVARISAVIQAMLEGLGFNETEEDEAIPLPNIRGSILEQVIEWCTHHKDDPPFVVTSEDYEESSPKAIFEKTKRTDNISQWDQQFMKQFVQPGDLLLLHDILEAANYLDIPGLLALGCKTFANLIKGKSSDEIFETCLYDGDVATDVTDIKGECMCSVPWPAVNDKKNNSIDFDKTLKFISSDDQIVCVDIKAAQLSVIVKTLLEELDFTEEDEEEAIPLPNIAGSILKKVFDWCTHHKDDLLCVENENTEKKIDEISEWDQQFLKVENSMLSDIIAAAEYLEIPGLLHLGCKAVADMTEGNKPLDEMYKTFFKDNDGTNVGGPCKQRTDGQPCVSDPKKSLKKFVKEPTIKFKSATGRVFSVDVKAARQSIAIKTMLDDLGFSEEDEKEAIPLPNIGSSVLKHVLEWCAHHKDDPPYVEGEDISKRPDDHWEYDQLFMKEITVDSVLFDIIAAAIYLDIPDLLDLGYKTAAKRNRGKGKTPDEINGLLYTQRKI